MGWGIGIGIGWPNASAGISYAKKLIKAFKERVLSYPTSIFEAEACLDATLTELNAIGLLKEASLVITPNAYNGGILYDVVPNTTLGDMNVVRATTATRVNSLGLIENVGLNVPRLDYSNGSCPSILVEPQRTNLILQSNTFSNASWGKLNTTVTSNAIVSPDGTTNASKLVAINPTGNNYINQTAANIAGNTTFTIYAKQGEYNGILLYNNTINTGRIFNLNNGTLGSVVGLAPINSIIESVGNDWYRVTLITNSTASNEFRVYIANNNAFGNLGNGTSGIFVYGAQLEAGSYATSYIPTVASIQTRNGDVISKTGISSLIGQIEGTVFFDVKALENDNITTRFITLSDGSFDNYLRFSFAAALNFATCSLISSGTTQATFDFSLIQTNNNKIAIKYKTNLFEIYVNGVLIRQDLTVNTFIGTTLSSLLLSTPTSAERWNGYLKSLQLYKTALTDQECINLTTL